MKIFWRILLAVVLFLFLQWVILELYRIGTRPDPHRSVNPYSVYDGKMSIARGITATGYTSNDQPSLAIIFTSLM